MAASKLDPRQQTLRERLHGLGFDEVRFASVAGGAGKTLRDWLAAGMHADMHWMERSADKRQSPDLVLPGARSAIMLGVNYWSEKLAAKGATPPLLATEVRSESIAPATGGSTNPAWARYALHEDYHDTIKPALVAAGRALEELFGASEQDYRYYVDTGPVLEREWATRAGLGFTGKNAMLISRTHGNWLFLATILTRLDFTSDEPITKTFAARGPEPRSSIGLLCGKCTRCLDACPTDAFVRSGVLDARRCISYQTIENKGVIPRELRAGIANRIYGCDVCLEVCPWNRFARDGRQMLLSSRYDLADLTLDEILALTPERFAEVFRRTPIKRLKLGGLLRNASIVAGNSGDTHYLPQLVRLATEHESSLVRAHAVWAARQLGGEAELTSARHRETEAIVLAEYE